MNQHISHAITRLRVVATLVIVAYHAACPYGGWEAFTGTVGGDKMTSMELINIVFQRLLCNDMLPLFFTLSGMLFYGRKSAHVDALSIFWKKFDRLIVPAALVFLFCSWFDIPFVGHAGPEGHLWFVYVLFLYFSFSLMLKKVSVHVLMFFAVAGYMIYTLTGRLKLDFSPFVFQLLRYYIYFVGGYYLFKHYHLLRKNVVRWPLLCFHILSLWVNFQTGYFLLFNLVILAFIPQGEIASRMVKSLNENSFGIYLIHHVLIVALFQVNFVYQGYADYPLQAITLMFFFILLLAWCLSYILHRIRFTYF